MKFADYLARHRDDAERRSARKRLRPILDLANDVLRLRLRKGWSQQGLAERVGTKQANISRIENGLANPSVRFLQRLADALETELVVRLDTEEIVPPTPVEYVIVRMQPMSPTAASRYTLTRSASVIRECGIYIPSDISTASDTESQPESVSL